MNFVAKWHLAILLTAALFCGDSASIGAAGSARTCVVKKDHARREVEISAPINPAKKDWVKDQLTEGRSVVLTNSYLFQLMKGAAQQNQKEVEEKTLVSLLASTLKGLFSASTHADTRRLFGVALLLLSDEPQPELGEQVAKQAESIRQNTMFAPRGHYTESEALRRFFRSMQYLAKATIDVSIRQDLFPYPKEMLFPFDTAESIHRIFSDPNNEALIRGWMLIHNFYSDVNGPPDCPTFSDLVSVAKGDKLVAQNVIAWAAERKLPKINPERGVGIQPLGERRSLHQEVIDDVRKKFIKDDTPRNEIAQLLRFKNLLKGLTLSDVSVQGLDKRLASAKGDTYYSKALKAIALGSKNWERRPIRLNMFAASMTSLAEQTALMSKTSILVRKSAEVRKKIPEGMKLYLEPDSGKYLISLAEASAAITRMCKKVGEQTGAESSKYFRLSDSSSTFRLLAGLARKGKPLLSRGRIWESCGPGVLQLSRKPSVTVDVFHVKDRTGKLNYYQWAVAPFEATYPAPRAQAKTKGLEMVFFEDWADEIVANHEGPLNNLLWEGRILEGNLRALPSILNIPE